MKVTLILLLISIIMCSLAVAEDKNPARKYEKYLPKDVTGVENGCYLEMRSAYPSADVVYVRVKVIDKADAIAKLPALIASHFPNNAKHEDKLIKILNGRLTYEKL